MSDAFQEGRHIPIMTNLVDFKKIKAASSDNAQVKFRPQGSLIGLNLKNRTGEKMIVTAIIVNKGRESALEFGGYFDWSKDGVDENGKAGFEAEYTHEDGNAETLSFLVYKVSQLGYELEDGNTDIPCFFVWGIQNKFKKGKPFLVQIRYKTTVNGTEQTTGTFKVYAPNSKVERAKIFDEGYAYNTVLTIKKSNNQGNGSVSLDFTTPLDFVAEAPAINKRGDAFVLNLDLPHTDLYEDIRDTEVGYYGWEQAKALFNQAWLKDKYYLPSRYQWQSIAPNYNRKSLEKHIHFNKVKRKYHLKEKAQVGETTPQEYSSDYVTVSENGKFVTYALRFKGTEWESAWRYSLEGSESTKDLCLLIKCVPLKNYPNASSLDLEQDIAKVDFFVDNKCSIRIFPTYGTLRLKDVPKRVVSIGSAFNYSSVTYAMLGDIMVKRMHIVLF